MRTVHLQDMNKDTVPENNSTKTDADQESYDNEDEATHRRKTPENSHSGGKESFTLLESCILYIPARLIFYLIM